MKAFPRFLTITGALLIVAAMVAHIICLATPNLVRVNFQSYAEKVNRTISEMISSGQVEDTDEVQEAREINPGLKDADLHFGLWKLCMKAAIMSAGPMEACFQWDTSFPPEGSLDRPSWVDGVKGCYIAGLVLAVLAVILSNTNVHTPSQGDRRRVLPIFICVTSILAGVIIFIGNMIVAFSHSKDFHFPGFNQLEPKVLAVVEKVLASSITVSWGFALDLTSSIVFILAGLFHLLAGRAAIREEKIRRQKEVETPLPNYDVAPL